MKKSLLLLVLTFLPLMVNASDDYLTEAKQKLASLYKYADRYENKLEGDEGNFRIYDIYDPDSLADVNLKGDLWYSIYYMIRSQGEADNYSIPKELYNPDIEVEIGTDAFYSKSYSSYNKVGQGTKAIRFNNSAFSSITKKYGRVSNNDFFYLEGIGPTNNPSVEIKLQGNTPSTMDLIGWKEPIHQVMSGKYDIMVVMVPYWYKIIAESGTVDANFLNQAYVDSVSAICKTSFTGQVRYNTNETRGEITSKKTNTIEYDGSKVDTLMLFEDFEFPYSYKDLDNSYPTLILQGATKSAAVKQGFIYHLCIDRVIMKSKENGEEIVITPDYVEYFTEGTKWTEIRLDTLKYDSWYSKVGDDWVPNFETIEYNVKGTITTANKNWEYPTYKCVYSNSQEWTDSLTLLISKRRAYNDWNLGQDLYVTVPVITPYGNTPIDAQAYFFHWEEGYPIFYNDLYNLYNHSGTTYNGEIFGTITEVKEGDFGGVRPLKYTDVNGVRFIDGIGATEWNEGECIFGPINPYRATAALKNKIFKENTLPYKVRHYRSMLVHFESNGEVLYDVWPEKPENLVTFTRGQMATIILPTDPDPELGKYYRLDRREDGKIIFEEELFPQAHVPYIIKPKEDFIIDWSTLDLEGCYRDSVSIDGITFIGSFVSEEIDYVENCYIDIIDITPDCREDDYCIQKNIIGALRAFLRVDTHWEDPYNPGGTRSIAKQEKLAIVLHDNNDASAINNITQEETINGKPTDGVIYDLTGRKITNGQRPTAKGIYIKNGKKILVK